MKGILKNLVKVTVFTLVLMVLCSLIYPVALTGVSQLTMKDKANGSLIDKNGELTSNVEEAVGSELIGQNFTDDRFFKGRVSSINYNTYTQEDVDNGDYSGVASGSFNYGNSNPDLEARIQEDIDKFLASHEGVKKEDIPAELLTASGSGLDPHISVNSAKVQIDTVVANTGLSVEEVEKIVKNNTEGKILGIFGQERVNVLKCNLEIAKAIGII